MNPKETKTPSGRIVRDTSKPYVHPRTGEVLEGGDQLTLTPEDERALDAAEIHPLTGERLRGDCASVADLSDDELRELGEPAAKLLAERIAQRERRARKKRPGSDAAVMGCGTKGVPDDMAQTAT